MDELKSALAEAAVSILVFGQIGNRPFAEVADTCSKVCARRGLPEERSKFEGCLPERVRCSSLVYWPVYPRLARTMRASNDAQCGAERSAPSGPSGQWRGSLHALRRAAPRLRAYLPLLAVL